MSRAATTTIAAGMPAIPSNGLIGDKARNYANMTAVGALIVCVITGLGLAVWFTKTVTEAAIDANRQQTHVIQELATEIRSLREDTRETNRAIRELLSRKQ